MGASLENMDDLIREVARLQKMVTEAKNIKDLEEIKWVIDYHMGSWCTKAIEEKTDAARGPIVRRFETSDDGDCTKVFTCGCEEYFDPDRPSSWAFCEKHDSLECAKK